MADYDQYRRMLGVNKHRLDDELEMHADVQERIGAECARLEAKYRSLKDTLERTEAGLFIDLKEDGRKGSIEELKGIASRDRSRIAAFEAAENARHDWQKWERLYDAWKSRDFSTRALGKLFGDGYFANDPIVNKERARRDAELNERRAEIRRTSERRESVQRDVGDQTGWGRDEEQPQPTGRRRAAL